MLRALSFCSYDRQKSDSESDSGISIFIPIWFENPETRAAEGRFWGWKMLHVVPIIKRTTDASRPHRSIILDEEEEAKKRGQVNNEATKRRRRSHEGARGGNFKLSNDQLADATVLMSSKDTPAPCYHRSIYQVNRWKDSSWLARRSTGHAGTYSKARALPRHVPRISVHEL